MKKILLFTVFTGLASTVFADMPMLLDVKKQQDQDWEKLACKNPKNLVVCEYSVPSSQAESCRKYQENSKKYNFLGRNGGASFGKEKYCLKSGADK